MSAFCFLAGGAAMVVFAGKPRMFDLVCSLVEEVRWKQDYASYGEVDVF
jgi:hypothetical protein